MSLDQPAAIADTPINARQGQDDVGLGDVVSILGRRKAWVFGLPLLLLGAAAAYSLLAKPVYTTSAQIYVDPRERTLPKEQQLNNVPGDGIVLVESQLKLITSDEVLSRVSDKLHLKDDAEFGRSTGLFAGLRGLLGQKPASDPALAALRALRQKTAAKRIDRSYVIDVLASADSPEKATKIANEVAQTYLASLAEADDAFNKKTSAAINARLEDLRQAVQKSETEVETFRSNNGLVGPRSKMVTEQQLDEVNTDLTTAKTKLADAQAKVQQLEQARRSGNLGALPEAVQSTTISQLRAQSATVTRDEALLSEQYGPAHPALIAVKAQKRDIEAAINAEIARIAQAAKGEAARAQSNVQSLQASFDGLKAQQVSNDKAMVPLRELERKAEANRAIYEAFLAKAKTAQETQGIDTNNARMISNATLPEQKSWPPTAILLGGAAFGGLTLGIALALLRDAFARRKQRPVQVNVVQTSKVVAEAATIPAMAVTAPAIMPMAQKAQVDVLSRDILSKPSGQVVAIVRLSQSIPATFAVELAETIRDAGKVVLLIDADRDQQQISTHFGFGERPGLQDIANGTLSIYDAARYHRASQLNIVPAGLSKGQPLGEAEQLALGRAIQAARDFDAVLIDAGSAAAALADTALLRQADEVILAGHAAQQADPAQEEALRQLQAAGVKARLIRIAMPQPVAA